MLDQQQNDQSPINPEQDTYKLINDVEILAGTLKTDDPTVSGQLLKIATALRENKADHWASIDLYQLIDPRSVRARLLNKPRSQWFSRIEMFRNILLFAPVIVTWIGVANAVDGYYALIQNQPQLSQTPFLYLWQDGFNGTVFLTLSRLGEVNAVLLVMIIIATTILSWSAIGRSSVSNDEISKRYESLVEIIGRLTNKLAETQTKSITSQLIDGINQSIEAIEQQNDAIKKNQDFVQQSQREFLSRLTEALTRIPSVELFRVNVDAVKEQIDQLASSMRAFTTSSSEMQKSVQTMAASHGQINQTLETISREIARYTTKQDAVITQVTTSSERIGEISTDFAQKLEKTAQSYITSLTESSKQYNESIADTSTRFADKMADTAQQLQLSYDRYSVVTSGANATISQVGEIITSFHEYQSQLNASSEKLTNEVNSSINIVQQRIGEMNQINDQKAQSSEAVLRGYTSTVTDLKNSIDPLSASIPAISAQLTDVNTLFSRLAPVFTSIQTATDATMQQRAAISQISDTLTQFSSNHQTLIAALESERSAQFLLAKETSQSIGQVERIKSQLEQVMADLRIISIAVTQAPPTAGSSARLRAAYRRRRRAPRAAAGNAAALQSARREPDAGSATLRDAAAPTDAASWAPAVEQQRPVSAGETAYAADAVAPSQPLAGDGEREMADAADADVTRPITDHVGAEYVRVPAGAGLAEFWMLRTPVTNAMWRAAVQAGAVKEPRRTDAYNDAAKTQHPVVEVTREQARAYATWVGGRLPRDAEWTRAAQGDDGRTYPWGEQPPDATRANCRPHGPGGTTPVGSYPAGASPYGLLDMAGNVWEWVDDGDFVVRGGAFLNDADNVVCGARIEFAGSAGIYYVGFRVVSPGP